MYTCPCCNKPKPNEELRRLSDRWLCITCWEHGDRPRCYVCGRCSDLRSVGDHFYCRKCTLRQDTPEDICLAYSDLKTMKITFSGQREPDVNRTADIHTKGFELFTPQTPA
jgi:hypothetical protein